VHTLSIEIFIICKVFPATLFRMRTVHFCDGSSDEGEGGEPMGERTQGSTGRGAPSMQTSGHPPLLASHGKSRLNTAITRHRFMPPGATHHSVQAPFLLLLRPLTPSPLTTLLPQLPSS